MKIKLDDDYCIIDDGNGYRFCKTTTKNNPKTLLDETSDVTICYPASLESALKRYAREVNLDYEGHLQGYFDRLNKTLEDARELC